MPYVVEVNPLDGALNVEGDVVVTAVFSEAMDPATIDATTFLVTGPTGNVPGTVTYNEWTYTVRFQPVDQLTKLESYTVTVAGEVSDLDGYAIGGPLTWTFTVAERWWHPPQPVQVGARAFYPDAGCDGEGNVIAVWLQSDGSGPADLVGARRVGSTWEAPVPLEASDHPISTFEIDVLPSGNAIVDWYQYGIWITQYRTGGYGWGPAVELDNLGNRPSSSMNAAGDVMVVWDRVSQVMVAHYIAGIGWAAPTSLSTRLGSDLPRVVLAESGDALVLWAQNQGDVEPIWAREYSVDAGWSTPVQIAADSAGWVWALTVLPSGEALALWTDTGSGFPLLARRFVPGVGWAETTTLYDDPEIAAWDVRVALDAVGSATVAWVRGEANQVVSRSFDAETETWTAPGTWTATHEPSVLRLAVAPGGEAFAAWQERRKSNGDYSIVAAHQEAGGFVASDVEDLDTSGLSSVALAACPGGTAIVLWTEEEPGAVYSSEYR